ncbi:MAG: PAS domain S-box protein [Deltaproteobacteria bacterium]|nr:PAS domain S-box protein [Deltaproteobacteria bacterium]
MNVPHLSTSPESEALPGLILAGAADAGRSLGRRLIRAGLPLTRVRTWNQLLPLLDGDDTVILLVHPSVKGLSLPEGLRLVRKIFPQTLTLVLGPVAPELAGQALQAGAEGLLPADLSMDMLLDWLASYAVRRRLRRENEGLRERIHQAEAHLASILDHLEEGVLTADAAGRVLTANRAAHHLLGASPGSLVSKNLQEFPCGGAGPAHLGEAVRETLTRGGLDGRLLLTAGQGPPFPVFLRGSPYAWGGCVGVILALRDLTAQEEMELRLEEQERLAALGRIAQGIAHEVRNPLMAVGGLVRRLERHLPPDNPGRNYLPGIQEGVQRLEQMVREIDEYLFYARAAGRHREEVDLETVVNSALARLRREQDLTGVQVEVQPAPPLAVRGDPASLAELFYQLLVNGVEAMDGRGALTISTREEDGLAVVAVADQGRGIAPEALPHLSHPFFTTKMTGAGMGLTKVHLIAGRHRGRVEVESRLRAGATFTVRLPLAGDGDLSRAEGVRP